MHWLFDILGIAGSACIVVAYYLTISGRLDLRRPLYSLLNAIGATLLLISLSVDFNLGATVIESFWLLISLYGFARSSRPKAAAPHS
ncbi:MAG: CBU_0592 family membrane protein [Planctomycetota bacterium]|jgi:hypothetical protein